MHHFCAGCWYVVQLVLDLIIYNQIIHKIIVENQQSTLKLLSSICRYLVIAIICCHVTMYTRRFTFQIFPVVQSFDCLFEVDHRVLPNCKFETKSFKKVFYFPKHALGISKVSKQRRHLHPHWTHLQASSAVENKQSNLPLSRPVQNCVAMRELRRRDIIGTDLQLLHWHWERGVRKQPNIPQLNCSRYSNNRWCPFQHLTPPPPHTHCIRIGVQEGNFIFDQNLLFSQYTRVQLG